MAALRWSIAGLPIVLASALTFAGMATAQQASPMTRQDTARSSVPGAVCNDGSTPVFYFRAGSGPDRDKWVIYFQGGTGCTSEASCKKRSIDQPKLTTASRMPPTMDHTGILSPLTSVNPHFARYNHVFVHYCSSDFWAGANDRRFGSATWHFQGKAIVDAVIETLRTRSFGGAATLATATDVLVTGSSAGAMGTHNNLDHIAARLPTARVKGLLDSGWIPNIEPFGPGIFDVMPYGAEALSFFNAKPDESCVAANPKNAGMCLNQEFAFAHLKNPAFVFADQRDPSLMSVLGIVGPPSSDAERKYVMTFARSVRDGLAKVPAYFAAARTRHTILLEPEFTTLAVDGVKFADTFANWYFDRPGRRQIVARPGP